MAPQPEYRTGVSPAQAAAWAQLWRILLTPRTIEPPAVEDELPRAISSQEPDEDVEHNPAA